MNLVLSWIAALIAPSVLKILFQRVAIALGVSVISYAGVRTAFNLAESAIASHYGQLPANTLVILSLAGVDRAMSVILSAMITRLTLRGLTDSGVLKRIFWMGNGASVLN